MSQHELIQVPAHHMEYKGQLTDGGHKLVVYTPQLLPEQVSAIVEHTLTPGWFVFRPNHELQADDIPEIDVDVEAGEKSPSQRLRGVLYAVWDQRTTHKVPFEIWYRAEVDKLIANIKQKYLE